MLSAALLAFAGTAVVQANPVQPTAIHATVQDDRTPVKPEDLPDAVKTTLSGEAYAGWTVKEAFAVAPSQGTPYFEVTLQKEEETQIVNLDADGQTVTPDAPTPVEETEAPEAPETPQVPETPETPQTPTPQS